MDNYEYCAQWASKAGGRVLDYGCGAGQVVRMIRDRGVEGFGCDVFYGGNAERTDENVAADIRPFVLQMRDGLIPFPDAHFDAVITNQVLEHVPDLDLAVREMSRVLKPGGVMLALFPDRSVWREGHCGVPFLHWFPKRSTPRIFYAAALRALGAGYHKQQFPGVMNWARSFCEWLDRWTYYRSIREIHDVFDRHFKRSEHREAEWFVARVPRASVLPAFVRRMLSTKLAGIVLQATR